MFARGCAVNLGVGSTGTVCRPSELIVALIYTAVKDTLDLSTGACGHEELRIWVARQTMRAVRCCETYVFPTG